MKLLTILRVAFATVLTLACMVEAAHADPVTALIGAAFTAIGSGASAGAFISAIVSMAAKTLLSAILAPAAPKQKIGVHQKLDSGGDNPLSFVMGQLATAGKLVYVNETETHESGATPNNRLTLVISLGEVPYTALSSEVHINGERCNIDFSVADADGFYYVTEYNKNDTHYCYIKYHDGSQTTADPWLLDKFGADPDKPWTDDMIGRGVSYLIVQCAFSQKGVWSGIPEFKWVVKGLKLYDPRKDSSVGGSGAQRWLNQSTWTYSENPKVMQFNIIRGIYYDRTWIYGGQAQVPPYKSAPPVDAVDLEAYQLPLSYWFAAMNVCDQDVAIAGGGTIKRYTAACEITADTQPIDVIKELDKACAGYTTEYGGLWKTWCGAPGASVFSFTDADIIITEEQTDNLFRPLQDTYNGARATYVNQNAGWVMKDAAPRIFDGTHGTDDLVTEDGGYQLIADMQLPMVTNFNQAQRLMRLAVLDNRRQITHVMQLPPEAGFLESFDAVTWTSDRNGYDHKKFKIESIEDLPNCNQLVMLRELNPDDYDWNTSFELPETVGTLTPVRPGLLALDFSVYPDQVDSDTGGKDKPAIRLEWTWGAPDFDLSRVNYEIRKLGTTKTIIASYFDNTNDSNRIITDAAFRFGKTYQVRIMPVPYRRGRDSSWTGWQNVTLFNVDIPSAPALTRVSELADDGTLDFYLDIDWSAVAGDATYVVRVAISGGSTRTYRTQDNNYRLPVTSGKTFTVDVRAVAADGGSVGNYSPSTAITVTKKNTAPTTPTALTLVADFHKLILDWPASPDKDYAFSRVYEAATNNFASASAIKDIRATGWSRDGLGNLVTRYYWITYFDRSGNESAKWPVSNTGGISGTTTAITDSDTDGTGPATPTGLTLAQRTNLNGDGKVEINVRATWTAIANAKASYVLRVYDGSEYRYFDSKDTAVVFDAISGTTYTISVAAVSGAGVIGSYTSNVTITPVKKGASPTAPTSLTAVGKLGRIVARWNKSPDSDFRRANLYAASVNNFTSATLIDSFNATKGEEGDLGNGVTRYYWVTFEDRSGNESAKFPTSNTAGIAATTVRVTDDDTDPTPLAAPTGLTLSQVTKRDKDGTIKTYIKATCTPPTGATARTSYVYWIDNGTDPVFTRKSDDVAEMWLAEVGVTLSVKVRALGFNNSKGTLSSAVNITPVKKASDLPTPSGFNATGNSRRVKLDWTDIDDDAYPDYQTTGVWKNTTGVTPLPGTTATYKRTRAGYLLDDDAVIGTVYSYYIAHRDTSGNWTAVNGPQTAAAGKIVAADLANAIVAKVNTTGTPSQPAAGTLFVSQDARAIQGDGSVVMSATVWVSALPAGAETIAFEIDDGSAVTTVTPLKGLKSTIPLVLGTAIAVSCYGVGFSGNAGAKNATPVVLTPLKRLSGMAATIGLSISRAPLYLTIQLNFDTSDGLPPIDYDHTDLFVTSGPTFTSALKIGSIKAFGRQQLSVPPDLAGYLWTISYDQSGVQTAMYPTSGGASTTFSAFLFPGTYNAIGELYDFGEVANDASLAVASSTVTSAASATIDLTSVRKIKFDLSFVNDDTVDRLFSIRLFKTNMSGASIRAWSNIRVVTNGQFNESVLFDATSYTGSDDFILAVSCGSATAVRYRKLSYDLFKR